jgi:DNA processing protein
MPYNFPRRNRIISGLSDAVIVVEATIKSGAMTTASHAASQGIEVFSVPGSILSEVSQGTNKLISEGAIIFTGLEDIASKLNIRFVKNDTEKKLNLTAFENKIFNLINDIPIHIDELNRITSVDIKQLYGVLFELQLKNEIMCLAGNFYVREINKI